MRCMLLAFYSLDDRPSLWSQVFTPEVIIFAAFASALVSGTWFAARMYMKRGGKPLKPSANFKYFAIATIVLMIFALPSACMRYAH
jgi:hypothetical protein